MRHAGAAAALLGCALLVLLREYWAEEPRLGGFPSSADATIEAHLNSSDSVAGLQLLQDIPNGSYSQASPLSETKNRPFALPRWPLPLAVSMEFNHLASSSHWKVTTRPQHRVYLPPGPVMIGSTYQIRIELVGDNGTLLTGNKFAQWQESPRSHFARGIDAIFICDKQEVGGPLQAHFNASAATIILDFALSTAGTFLVHLDEIGWACSKPACRSYGPLRLPIQGSPFTLVARVEVPSHANSTISTLNRSAAICTADDVIGNEGGRWLACNLRPELRINCLREGWTYVLPHCTFNTWTYEELLSLAATGPPLWIAFLGTSITRGLALALVDLTLTDPKSLFHGQLFKCWGYFEVTIGRLRISYQDFRLLHEWDHSSSSISCHNGLVASKSEELFNGSVSFLRWLSSRPFHKRQGPSALFLDDFAGLRTQPLPYATKRLPSLKALFKLVGGAQRFAQVVMLRVFNPYRNIYGFGAWAPLTARLQASPQAINNNSRQDSAMLRQHLGGNVSALVAPVGGFAPLLHTGEKGDSMDSYHLHSNQAGHPSRINVRGILNEMALQLVLNLALPPKTKQQPIELTLDQLEQLEFVSLGAVICQDCPHEMLPFHTSIPQNLLCFNLSTIPSSFVASHVYSSGRLPCPCPNTTKIDRIGVIDVQKCML